MKVDELLANARDLVGEVVAIEGYFVFVDEEGFVVESSEKRADKQRAIKVVVDGLKKRMLARVPPLGGGKYYYLHKAAITGRLSPCTDGEFSYALVDVVSLQVETSCESFCAIP